MIREDKYLLGCLYAINRLTEKGSIYFAVKDDEKWESIPWEEITKWIKKQYVIEESEEI
jgi:hypothetical protein